MIFDIPVVFFTKIANKPLILSSKALGHLSPEPPIARFTAYVCAVWPHQTASISSQSGKFEARRRSLLLRDEQYNIDASMGKELISHHRNSKVMAQTLPYLEDRPWK